MGEVCTVDNHHIIAAAEIDFFNIGNRNRIVLITQVNRIDAVAKVDRYIVLACIKRQRLIFAAANQLGLVSLAPIGIKTLGVDTIVTAMAILVTALPGDDKTAIAETRYRWILLFVRCIRIDPELITNSIPILVKNLAKDILATAAIRVIGAGGIEPGDHKAAILKPAHRRLVLLSTKGTAIYQELIDIFNRCRQRIAIAVCHRKGLGKNIITVAAAAGAIAIAAAMARIITPGHHKAIITMRRH